MAAKEILRPPDPRNFPGITFPGFRFLLEVAREINNAMARLVVNETVEDWIAPTLMNGWVDYEAGMAPAGYYKDPFGRVHLRGVVKDGTVDAAAFTLPTGYRPAAGALIFFAGNAEYTNQVSVLTTGDVIIAGVGNGWRTLNGVSFRAA
jgi:hypothetical protein